MRETAGIRHEMWFVMLKSAKDQVLGVDTPGQQVPPMLRRSVRRGRLWASGVFLALRWVMLEKLLGVGAVRRWLYLAAKAIGVGSARRCLVLSLQWAMAHSSGDVKPPRA
jgi:hypothetical protein